MRQLDGRFFADAPIVPLNTKQYVDPTPSPTWMETLNANLGYQYKHYVNAYHMEKRYGDVAFDDSLDVMAQIKGTNYERYYGDLKDAKNQDHLDDLIAQIDAMQERRQILANSSIWSQLTTGLFDPVNLIALPFGGPALGIGRSALRVGLGVATIQAPLEVGRQVFDPSATYAESGLNMGAAFFVGGTLGGLMAIPGNVKANAIIRTNEEINEMAKVTNAVPAEQMAQLGQRDSRQFQLNADNAIPVADKTDQQIQSLSTPKGFIEFMKKESGVEDLRGILTQAKIKKANEYFAGEAQLRKLEGSDGKIKSQNNLLENLFTSSWLYKGVTNPYKRVLQSKEYSQDAKMAIIKLIGDHGTALQANQMGVKTPQSVYIQASLYEREWVKAYDDILAMYGEFTGKGKPVESKFDYFFRRKKFDEWLEATWVKSQTNAADLTPLETKVADRWNKFFRQWDERLKETGHIPDEAGLARRLEIAEAELALQTPRIQELAEKLNRQTGKLSKKDRLELDERSRIKTKLDNEIETLKVSQETLRAHGKFRKSFKDENFFPRFWNKEKIRNNREQLKQILITWFSENPIQYVYNPQTRKVQVKTLSRKPDDVAKRADETIDQLLGEGDPFANLSYGYGKSKHLKHRLVDIPNSKVTDFIVTNPVQVMMAYTNRTAAQYEFYKTFNFEDPEVAFGRILAQEAQNGVSEKSLNRLRRDFLHSYDRVAGVVLQNPEALSLRTAQVMKDLATLNYLGSAGFSTLPDAAVVMMQNELKPLFKQIIRVLDNEKVRMNAMEARQAGEMLEILKGDVHLRLMEDMLNNPFQNTFVSKVKNAYFQLNLLGPMTRTFKMMSSMAHSHTIIDYSVKMAQGKTTKRQAEWLLRLGIDKRDASKIAKMWDDNIIENTEGFYLANTSKWTDQEAVDIFQRTLNAGVKNTVLMGSPADKPINVDGVFYLPMRVARMAGMKEDPRFKGYARVENALLGLPFQFYSYSFAALNKITTLYTQNQVTNRLVGIGMAMGLAYMGMQLKYRSNPFVLEEMALEDKIARSFDMSGLAALYSDMYYTSIQTSLALGGPDLTMGLISPKFPQEKNYVDAVTAPLGAGVSITTDLARAAYTFSQGDYGEGAKEFISNLPGARLWFMRDLVNDMSRGIAGRLG